VQSRIVEEAVSRRLSARRWTAHLHWRWLTRLLGGYEAWCRTVGGILKHAEIRSFLGNLPSVYEVADEETAEWEHFLLAVKERFPETFTAIVIAECIDQGGLSDVLPDALERDRTQDSFPKSLGKAFQNDRIGATVRRKLASNAPGRTGPVSSGGLQRDFAGFATLFSSPRKVIHSFLSWVELNTKVAKAQFQRNG
jgi:hypothetical protein